MHSTFPSTKPKIPHLTLSRLFYSSILDTLSTFTNMSSDIDFDDDAPPMLVAAGEQPEDSADLATDVDDLNMTRVPITIITGMQYISGRSRPTNLSRP